MAIIRMFSSENIENKVENYNNVISVHTKSIWNQDQRICIPRNNQQYVMDRHMYAKYLLMIQPPGSGKSMTIGFCMAQRLTENPNEKVIITVPQTMISKSFGKTILRFPEDDIEWDISNNLCVNTKREKGVELRDFLKRDEFNDGINSRIAICTHMTLASMIKELKVHPELLKNTTLIIDEAHHVLYPENGSRKSANRIGKLLKIQLEKDDPTFSLWLVTATFYRGDKGTVLPSHHMDMFEKYFLPMDVHWKENINYIKRFNLDFVIFNDNDPITEVKEVLKLGKRKSIIYCPCVGKLLQNYGTKYEFRDAVINAIYEVWPECNILDLIEENGREKQKEILEDDNLSKDIDIILAVKLLDEGTDWKFAEQALNIAPSESLRIENQRFGRLWRDVPGKEEIFYYVFLPKEANFKDEEDRRLHVSKACTAFIATMLLEEIVEPILYPRQATEVKSESEGESNERPLTPIEEQIPDEMKRQTVIADVTKELMFLRNIEEDPTPEQIQDQIISVLDKHNVKDNQEGVAKHIVIMLRRRFEKLVQPTPQWEKQIKSVNVQWMVEAGFDKVWTNDIFDTLLTFTTGSCGIETFEEFRRVYGDNKSAEEWYIIAKKLEVENGGKLYTSTRLKEMGLSALVAQILNNPEIFKDITRDFGCEGFNTVHKFVKLAEELRDSNDGILQNPAWIQKHYPKLYWKMLSQPDEFKHIPQKFVQPEERTAEEWVECSKEFLDEYNILPTSNKLPWGVQRTIINNKQLFKDMEQYKGIGNKHIITISTGEIRLNTKTKTVLKHKKIIEKIKKENNGFIPPFKVMNKAGYESTWNFIRKHQLLFKGEKQIILNSHGKIIGTKIIGEDNVIPAT